MPERLRSTSIALLGAVAAVGLATIAFALQLGLPSVATGPLPQAPSQVEVSAGRPLAEKQLGATSGSAQERPAGQEKALSESGSPAAAETEPAPVGTGGTGEEPVLVTGSPRAQVPPASTPSRPPQKTPPGATPVSAPVAAPPAAPAEPTATSSEVPLPAPEEEAPEEPEPSHPGNGNAYGKGNGNGVGNGGVPPGHAKHAAKAGE